MEALLFLLCIIILIILITIKSDLASNLKALREKINFLDSELQRVKHYRGEEKLDSQPVSPVKSSEIHSPVIIPVNISALAIENNTNQPI